MHARDLEATSDFMETIYGSPVRGLGEDKMYWIPSKDKGFLVSDYYRILVGTTFYGFPWKSIWKQKIPSRVAFFDWTAALGKCLTIDNLRKRKVWILDSLLVLYQIAKMRRLFGLYICMLLNLSQSELLNAIES